MPSRLNPNCVGGPGRGAAGRRSERYTAVVAVRSSKGVTTRVDAWSRGSGRERTKAGVGWRRRSGGGGAGGGPGDGGDGDSPGQ